MTPEIKNKIEQINRHLDREEHDSGYAAFVHMRKLWPELIADYARSSERTDEAMIEAVREVCARQAERFYDNPNLEDHLKPALEVARICGKQISDSIRKLHFNDAFRASVSGSTEGGK